MQIFPSQHRPRQTARALFCRVALAEDEALVLTASLQLGREVLPRPLCSASPRAGRPRDPHSFRGPREWACVLRRAATRLSSPANHRYVPLHPPLITRLLKNRFRQKNLRVSVRDVSIEGRCSFRPTPRADGGHSPQLMSARISSELIVRYIARNNGTPLIEVCSMLFLFGRNIPEQMCRTVPHVPHRIEICQIHGPDVPTSWRARRSSSPREKAARQARSPRFVSESRSP